MIDGIGHFYIPEDQSIYLLSSHDALKLKNWIKLCIEELTRLGYRDVELIGKGAFGFAFAGIDSQNKHLVFKFTRMNLPQSVHDKLAEEAHMLGLLSHPNIPKLVDYQRINKQSVMVMERAPGIDLEQYSLQYGAIHPHMAHTIMVQLLDILDYLHQGKPVIHGDIKPSNLVWDELTQQVSLIDWGSCVFAQLGLDGQFVEDNVLNLLSHDQQTTNTKLGDVYFIGPEQLAGQLSSPMFDYQGMASTIYALCSAQGSRFGKDVITPYSIGLPKLLADVVHALLGKPAQVRDAIKYIKRQRYYLSNLMFNRELRQTDHECILPWRMSNQRLLIETVVYSSRKSFLREQGNLSQHQIDSLSAVQFDRYYKQYLQGMGETEKAFLAAVSRLGQYPVVGGLAIRWQASGISVDSNLNIYHELDATQHEIEHRNHAFIQSMNNVITLARAINRPGVFKACLFNARSTLHIERDSPAQPFNVPANMSLEFMVANHQIEDQCSQQHSYFEDGDDPDEYLQLPPAILSLIEALNQVHHSGCIIFEALPTHLKIHNFLQLFDREQSAYFHLLLQQLLQQVPNIKGLGISGFMKLPNKDTRHFTHQVHAPDKLHPRNVRVTQPLDD